MADLYFTVKVERAEHPKWRSLAKLGHSREACAAALWLALMGRCARAQNGGSVPPSWPVEVTGWPAEPLETALTDLAATGLLDVAEDGWRIHDFDDHQHELLSARAPARDQAPEPPPGLSAEERKRWLQKERARRYRDAKRDVSTPKRDGKRDASRSQRDAERDGNDAERDAKRDERDGNSVTESVTRHANSSRSVTLDGGPRHASPFFSTERDRDRSDAGAREESESVTHHAPSRVTPVTLRHADEESESGADGRLTSGFIELVRASFAKGYRERDLKLPPECTLGTGPHQRIVVIAKALEDVASLEAAVRGFFGDPKTASEGYPLAWLERNPNRYVQAGRGSQAAIAALPPGAAQAPASGGPRWMPGGPEAVTDKSLDEVIAGMLGAVGKRLAFQGHTGPLPREMVDPVRYRDTWVALATWACSRTHRSRMGDRETAPQPALKLSAVWWDAVKGWIADPEANGEGGHLCMRVLIREPERMWAEGRAVSP